MKAKRRDDAGSFAKTIKPIQLMRILLTAPSALVALYEWDSGRYLDCIHPPTAAGRVAVLPMIQVATDWTHVDAMCRFSTTLGHQFAVRFLNGADLTHGSDLAGSVLGATRSEYLVMIGAGRERSLEDIIAENPAVERKMADYEDLRIAINEMKLQAETQAPRKH